MRILLVMGLALTVSAQTKIDLRTQTKNVDFTAASSTKPVKMGTEPPATCSAGELFFKTNAPGGANVYGCVETNRWSVQGGIVAKSGTLADMPTTCRTGENYFATDVPAGNNLYLCTGANTWAAQGINLAIKSDGAIIRRRAEANFRTGPGIDVSDGGYGLPDRYLMGARYGHGADAVWRTGRQRIAMRVQIGIRRQLR